MPKTPPISTLLLLALASGCGTPRASLPPPPAEISLRADLLQACESLATPPASALPALAADPNTRAAQLAERAFWMEFVLQMDGVSARACVRYLELRDLVLAYNAAARSAREAWP